MGMRPHVVGIKPPDEKWKKMKAIRDACIEADVHIPDEVDKFFDFGEPDDAGVVVNFTSFLSAHPAVKHWEKGEASGYEIDISKLDPDIKVLRFYNSW